MRKGLYSYTMVCTPLHGIVTIISGIIQLFGHCIVMWYAMSRSLVKLTEIGTSWVCG